MGLYRIYKVGSPYNAEEVPEIDFVQSFDVMYLAHINHAPAKLTRQGHTDWLFSDVTFGPTISPPTGMVATATVDNTDADNGGNAYFAEPATYIATAVSAETGQETRASNASTCTNDLTLKRNFNSLVCDVVTGASRYRWYKAQNTGAFGFIGESDTPAFTDNFIDENLTVGPPLETNPFVDDGDDPSTVTFFEGRLWWGRTRNNPNALYSSRSADFENMDTSVPLRADDAISIRLVAQGVNQINQLVPMQQLLCFSSDGIFKLKGSNDDYLSASPPPQQQRQSGRGCSRLSPIVIDSMAFYKTINSADVYTAGYDFQIDGIKSDNVCIFSPDLFEGFDIVSWCYAEQPFSVVVAARSDGAMLAFTWEKEQQVWGWTICPLPNDGKLKSVCCVQEMGGDGMLESRVYGIIEFTIAGVARQVRCRMASGRWRGLALECHLDCSTTQQFDDPSTFADGLWHLEGETVAAFVDGVEVEGLVVADGRATLPEGYSGRVITVGLPYDVTVETLPLSIPANRTSTGRKHTAGKALISLVRSRAPRLGIRKDRQADVSDDRMRPLKVPYVAAQSDEASLLDGVFSVTTDPVVSGEAKVLLKHRIGPLTVTGIYLDTDISGD